MSKIDDAIQTLRDDGFDDIVIIASRHAVDYETMSVDPAALQYVQDAKNDLFGPLAIGLFAATHPLALAYAKKVAKDMKEDKKKKGS